MFLAEDEEVTLAEFFCTALVTIPLERPMKFHSIANIGRP